MSYPYELKYDANHHWCRRNGDGTVTVGITTVSVLNLTGMGTGGQIVHVQTPGVGAQLAKGQSAGTIEGSMAVGEIYGPIAGAVTASNGDLGGEPMLVRDDPYGDGWLFAIRPANPADLDSLMNAEAYGAYTNSNG